MKTAYSLHVAALASLFAFTGCGSQKPALYPVSGKVFQGDKPAIGARVIFHPRNSADSGAAKPIGNVDDNGDFTLKCDNQPGAPAGEYTVTVHWQLPKQNPFSPDPPDLLEGRFANPSTTRLRATIDNGPTVVPVFRVD